MVCAIALDGAADAQNAPSRPGDSPPAAFTTPAVSPYQSLSEQDAAVLRDALSAARGGDLARAQADREALTHPIARKIAQWAMIDVAPARLSFFDMDQARRDLWGWPRGAVRQQSAERLLETAGLAPKQVVSWFDGAEPQTAQGAMALAAAYRQLGQTDKAKALIGHVWRDTLFDADTQRSMLTRFGDLLTVQDHVARMDSLLYGPQGPAARDLLPLLPPEQQTLAQARMAYRSGAANAGDMTALLPPALAKDPGLVFEQARYLRSRNLDDMALRMVADFPSAPGHPEGAKRIWSERWALFRLAMKDQNYRAAYDALNKHGLPPGPDAADADFYAGWLALTKLKDPKMAAEHFARMRGAGTSPITQGKALYWSGRTAEAVGDTPAAKDFYGQAARFYTTFYGQLAAEKTGLKQISIGKDPPISAADRARFNGREQVQAAQILGQIGERDLFRTFVLSINDSLPNAEETALLVDLCRNYADQDVSMKVVRAAARRGFILPERGYPLRTPPVAGIEPALILGITRQESGFDPMARSAADARGMMQLLPSTAKIVATRMGMSFSTPMLNDPDYNMRLGSTYISQMVDQFSGSYLLAAAAYNAGPGRPNQWVTSCGDPRSSLTDPADFIECIPIMETHDYVMRVLEGMQVYRARLNGGVATIAPMADLKRGGYQYGGPAYGAAAPPPAPLQTSYPLPSAVN